MTELSADQRRRYSRNIMLAEIGRPGQEKLLRSGVLVVGSGALGSICAMYLAASGVGRLGVCDFDTVDISNLQRQLSFTEADLGKPKTAALASRLRSINSDIIIEEHPGLLNQASANRLFPLYDLIIEGSDNPATKYLVSDTATRLSRPCILGGVSGWQGQVTTLLPGSSTYRDLFPEAADEGGYTPCSLGGVLGPLPGIVASVQAAEAVKVLAGAGKPLNSRLLLVDALSMTFNEIEF